MKVRLFPLLLTLALAGCSGSPSGPSSIPLDAVSFQKLEQQMWEQRLVCALEERLGKNGVTVEVALEVSPSPQAAAPLSDLVGHPERISVNGKVLQLAREIEDKHPAFKVSSARVTLTLPTEARTLAEEAIRAALAGVPVTLDVHPTRMAAPDEL